MSQVIPLKADTHGDSLSCLLRTATSKKWVHQSHLSWPEDYSQGSLCVGTLLHISCSAEAAPTTQPMCRQGQNDVETQLQPKPCVGVGLVRAFPGLTKHLTDLLSPLVFLPVISLAE
jgi:hypothetical protein